MMKRGHGITAALLVGLMAPAVAHTQEKLTLQERIEIVKQRRAMAVPAGKDTQPGQTSAPVTVAPLPAALTPGAERRVIPGSVTETYTVNAQYRGAVKKGFSDIGTGVIEYIPQESNQFQIRAKVDVTNPEDNSTYRFNIDMTFRSDANQITLVHKRNRYTDVDQVYQDRVERAMPFVYLLKYLPTPGAMEEPSRQFMYDGRRFMIRYVTTERHVEASIYEDDQLVTKAFISRDGGRLNRFEKFRVPGDNDVMVSFVIRS